MRSKATRPTFRPHIEALEDRCLLATQLMGSFDFSVGESRFWDGPVVHGSIIVPDFDGGDGFNHSGSTAVDTPICGQEGFPCWDYKFNLAEGGARFRFALDVYPLSVRTCPDCNVQAPVARFVGPLGLFPTEGNAYGVAVIDPNGNYHTVNYDCAVLRCAYSDERFVDTPMGGEWTIRITPFLVTDVGFRMRAKLETASAVPEEPTPLYPNLRIVPPFEFTFRTPAVTFGPGVDVPGPNTGCMAEEIADPETGQSPVGRACLRLSMGIENVGDGPLAIQGLSPEGNRTDATPTNPVVPASQRVYVWCGANCHEWRDLPAGSAGYLEYHPTHHHSHYQEWWSSRLFKVTDTRNGTLTPVGQGHMTGFAAADERLADWGRFNQCNRFGNRPSPYGHAEPCEYDLIADAQHLIGTGWADVYEWNRSGNYVDMDLGPDLNPVPGYYVVQGTTDPEDRLLETRDNDNVSYALIYVSGRDVYVCERGYGESPWDPNRKLARPMPTNEPPVGSGTCDIGLSKAHFAPGDEHPTDGDGPDFYGLPLLFLSDPESDIPPASGSSEQPTTSSSPQMEVATVDDYFATSETEDVGLVLVSADETTAGDLLLDDPLLPDPLDV